MSEHLKKVQRQIISLFKENKNKLPSYREIAKKIGISSTNTVFYHVKILKRMGYLQNHAAGISDLTFKTILNLQGKSGVYVIFEESKGERKPMYVGEAEDIKKDFFLKINGENQCIAKKISDGMEKVEIAFYSISDSEKRKETHRMLAEKYSGEELC